MATLKDIWNWPSNPGSGYATDTANWSGDASYGLDYRIADLLTGGYKTWTGLDPVADLGQTVDSASETFAKYKNYINSYTSSENLSFYKLHRYPVVEATWDYYRIPVTGFSVTMKDTLPPTPVVVVTHNTNPGWVDGNSMKFGSVTSVDFTGLNSDTSLWADVIDSTTTHLYGNSGLSTQVSSVDINWLNKYAAGNDAFISTSAGVKHYIRHAVYDTDHITYQQVYADQVATDGDKFRFINGVASTAFSDAGDTGTVATLNVGRWITTGDFPSNSDQPIGTVEYFTNSGRTTPATLNETYFGTITKTFTNSTGSDVTYSLAAIDISDTTDWTYTAGTSATLSDFRSDTYQHPWTSWARLHYANLSGGTITTGVGTNNVREFGSALDLDDLWFGYGNTGDIFTVGEQATDVDASHAQEFTLSAGASVDIVVKVINPATPRLSNVDNDRTWIIAAMDATETTGVMNRIDWFDKTTVSDLSIQMPGVVSYTYLDSGGATQYGAGLDYTNLWFPGDAAKTITTPSVLPTLNINLDGAGRINSTAIVAGGVWDLAAGVKAVMPVQALANEYVAPVPYAPDVWDTDDEWDSAGFDRSKRWPTHRVPNGAKIMIDQPSSSVRSQNGTKYVRDAGIVRYQVELTYAPMTYEDFRIFQRTVEAARGQTTPFYLQIKNLGPNNNQTILFNRADDSSITSNPRLKEPVVSGDKLLMLEGFEANQSEVFVQGEHFLTSGGNGYLHTVVNTVDSNIFGEAKIRIAYPHDARSAGEYVYRNPYEVVVTLAESGFEYNVGTDSLYRMTVKFDLDEFK